MTDYDILITLAFNKLQYYEKIWYYSINKIKTYNVMAKI